MMRKLLPALVFVAIVAVAIVATAGGGDATGDRETAGPLVPDVSVQRLDGSGTFRLRDLTRSAEPTLLWFWAPWCEVCNGEAPRIEAMALKARGELRVVAIGGRDDAGPGREFVERHALTTPTVLFDEPMAAWNAYGFTGQPHAILLDRDGRERGRWIGAFDPAEALEAARAI